MKYLKSISPSESLLAQSRPGLSVQGPRRCCTGARATPQTAVQLYSSRTAPALRRPCQFPAATSASPLVNYKHQTFRGRFFFFWGGGEGKGGVHMHVCLCVYMCLCAYTCAIFLKCSWILLTIFLVSSQNSKWSCRNIAPSPVYINHHKLFSPLFIKWDKEGNSLQKIW